MALTHNHVLATYTQIYTFLKFSESVAKRGLNSTALAQSKQ